MPGRWYRPPRCVREPPRPLPYKPFSRCLVAFAFLTDRYLRTFEHRWDILPGRHSGVDQCYASGLVVTNAAYVG